MVLAVTIDIPTQFYIIQVDLLAGDETEECMMEYFVALDSGGTKTDAVLFDETGHILLRHVGKGCNAMDIGRETAKARMLEIVNKMCAAAPKRVKSVYGAVAGIEYYGDYLYEYIRPQIDAELFKIEGDVGVMISSTLGRVEGAGMICGTGSALAIRRFNAPWVHVGGRGYLIDAKGSGFALAREGIYRAFRALDGRGEPTVLVELLEKKMGKPLSEAVCDLYSGGREYFASFAHLVFEGRRMGDRVCSEIIEEGSLKLAELTWAAAQHFEGDFPVVMGGGILFAFPEYVEMVKAKAAPRAKVILATASPVYGGAVEAMEAAGLKCDDAFREKFLREYEEWKKAH